MTGTVLILGATGRFGRAAGIAFARAGWQVRRFQRQGDDLDMAARGADVIVNGWNPPYPDWARLVPGLHAQVIRAAKAAGATVIVPGNVYVFGPDAGTPWSAQTPHLARNPLGRIRIDMEAAYRASGVRTILLRAGDFIDTERSGNWFDAMLVKSVASGRVSYPGDPDVPHVWAWLPDMARACVLLAERRESLPTFADIPFPGHTLTGQDLTAAIARVMPHPVRLTRMAWWPLQLARPVWPMAAGLIEMRYLWSLPHRLDGAHFAELLPDFRATPLEVAMARAVPGASVQGQIDPDQTVPAGS